jgi:predicted dehydrogenase
MKEKKISIGIIGCGNIAKARHIPEIIENPDVGEVFLASVNEKNIIELAKKYQIKNYFIGENAWEDLIKIPEIDGVIICTNNNLHAPIAIKSLNNGKHVLVEKPIAITLDEVESMNKAAENNQKILLVAHHRRHQSCYALGKTILESGFLGKIFSISLELKQPGPIEWAPNSKWFFQNPKQGGGVVFDLGIHMMDLLVWYTNDTCSDIYAVINQSGTPYEQAKILMKMNSDCSAVVEVAWGIFNPEKRVKVYCEKGVMMIDEYNEKGIQLFNYPPNRSIAEFNFIEYNKNSVGNPKFGVDDHFINCIINNDLQRTRLIEHLNAFKIVLKANGYY